MPESSNALDPVVALVVKMPPSLSLRLTALATAEGMSLNAWVTARLEAQFSAHESLRNWLDDRLSREGAATGAPPDVFRTIQTRWRQTSISLDAEGRVLADDPGYRIGEIAKVVHTEVITLKTGSEARTRRAIDL